MNPSLLSQLLPSVGWLVTLRPSVLGAGPSWVSVPGTADCPGAAVLGAHAPFCPWSDALRLHLAVLEARAPPAPTPPFVLRSVRGRSGLLEPQVSPLFNSNTQDTHLPQG